MVYKKGVEIMKLFYGEHIITMDEQGNEVTAVLVEDGRIKRVGVVDDFKGWMNDAQVEKLNLENKTLLPGFIDQHSHISMMGPFSAMANVRNCDSFIDIIDTLKTYINEYEIEETDVVL